MRKMTRWRISLCTCRGRPIEENALSSRVFDAAVEWKKKKKKKKLAWHGHEAYR